MNNDENKQAEITHDEVDIEEYAKRGENPPHARRYRIRIDRERYTVIGGGPSVTLSRRAA